ETASFKAKAVEPRSSQSGFLFFDVSDISNPLRSARFYLTNVHDSSGNALMYFEVPLDKAQPVSKPYPESRAPTFTILPLRCSTGVAIAGKNSRKTWGEPRGRWRRRTFA